MVNFTKIIESSFEWTMAVCFRPFNLKKWLILTFIAWMAGYLAGGGGLNLPLPEKKAENKQSVLARSKPDSQSSANKSDAGKLPGSRTAADKSNTCDIKERVSSKGPVSGAIISLVTLFCLFIIILMTWLFSRFSFIFLGAVAKNDASIRVPFREYKNIGNSLCGFYLFFTAGFAIVLGGLIYPLIRSLIKIGVFDKPMTAWLKQIFLTALPYGLLILLLIFISTGVFFITMHFVLPVMFKKNIKFAQAWPKVWGLLMANKNSFIIYILIVIALWICSGLAYLAVSLMAFLGLLLPGVMVALICYAIYTVIPPAFNIVYMAVLGMIFVPLLIGITYCLAAAYLPVAVFRRTLSMKFLGALNEDYDLFKLNSSGEALKGSIQKKQSPELAAVLSFFIPGLGQFYNGQAGKGLLVFCSSFLFLPWALGVIDAFQTAQKIDRGEIISHKKTGCLIAFLIGGAALGGIFLFLLFLAAVVFGINKV